MKTRTERDSLGEVEVPAARYWGAQTERARVNFAIGEAPMPLPLIRALGLVKLACARVNRANGTVSPDLAEAIEAAAQEVADGALDTEFPLTPWQSGSGTQTNMNANEVIANRANEALGAPLGAKSPVHPNDHVNAGQSSNDTIPTAIHLAAALELRDRLLPALGELHGGLAAKAAAFDEIVKTGRTHLMDAVPIRLGDEVGAWAAQVEHAIARLEATRPGLHALAQGGTAVGSGLNAPDGFGAAVAAELADLTGLPLVPAANRFEAIATLDAPVALSGALNGLAVSLTKIANDVRLLASGPRTGFAELILPANEPGSSIMPGKVNPTQAEALVMVCARVMGDNVTVSLAGASGALQLNTAKPVVADCLLRSIRLLADGAASFAARCVEGLEPDRERIAAHLEASLMLVTALSAHIGYDKAAAIAQDAHARGTSLREAALASGEVSAEQFDGWVRPDRLAGPGRKG